MDVSKKIYDLNLYESVKRITLPLFIDTKKIKNRIFIKLLIYNYFWSKIIKLN